MTTRPSREARSRCCSSGAPSRLSSAADVTSIALRRRPATTLASTHSSAYRRRATEALLVPGPRPVDGSQRRDQLVGLVPLLPDLVRALVEVGQRRMYGCKAHVRMSLNDLVRRHPLVLVLRRDLADLDVGTPDHRPRCARIDVVQGCARRVHAL